MTVLKRHALTAATILAALVWFVALRPAALGGPTTYVVVHGSSMTGTLSPGDLIVATAQPSYSIGDVVAYHIPDGPGKGDLVVHRIIGGDASGYTTRGDANKSPDPWHPTTSDIAGKLAVRLPGLGQIFGLSRSPLFFGGMWALVAFVLALGFTPAGRRVWSYTKVVGLGHWPLAPAERPTWVTQTVYRADARGPDARVLQVWSSRDKAWIDLDAFKDGAGREIWFGGPTIEFGDPMAIEAEIEAYIGADPATGRPAERHAVDHRAAPRRAA
jgi:signal peptidase I